ncbi:MAG: MFS transporter [Planctomycetaceae bacterium]|nr:MFS transporter [Planctomycetaceae bacterium]
MTQRTTEKTTFLVLAALASFHAFNDLMQSLIMAIYPNIHITLSLSMTQIGLITLVYQISSSMFQPIVGWYADRRPQPYALPFGMFLTLCGLCRLAVAASYAETLFAVVLIGMGSAIFHPEASRLAYYASGGRFGMAQSLFQVGGNFGTSIGPLVAALFITTYGQKMLLAFAAIPAVTICLMFPVSRWYKRRLHLIEERRKNVAKTPLKSPYPTRTIVISLCVLLILIFSKYVYWSSLGTFYQFYLMDKFHITIQQAQYCQFLFAFSVAAGTMIGGPIGDRFGRKYVIWVSILGVAPFTLALPHVQTLLATCVLSVLIGLILSSAFSAILIYAQELLPGKIGMIAGLFFGFAFGIAGISSGFLGGVADRYGVDTVYRVCSYLPLLGITTIFLPNMRKKKTELM